MKTQFHMRGLSVSADARDRLEESLEQLQSRISITAVAVAMEHCSDDAPAFRTFVSLAMPGPDIHAETRDYTLEAAWLKVTAALRKQIEQRKSWQRSRAETTHERRNGPGLKQRPDHPHTRSFCRVGTAY